MTCSSIAIQAELVAKNLFFWKFTKENSGLFSWRINQNCVFSCLSHVYFTKFWSLPSRKGLWVIVFTEVEEVLESKSQTEPAVEDRACLILSACPCWCQNPAMPQLFISKWTRVSADCQWTLAAGKIGLFSGHQCELCVVTHPARPPSATWRLFKRGP